MSDNSSQVGFPTTYNVQYMRKGPLLILAIVLQMCFNDKSLNKEHVLHTSGGNTTFKEAPV